MLGLDWHIWGGLLAGGVAGAAARYGRLCTMSALEDGVIGHDFRGLKAWGLALAVAIATTHAGIAFAIVDLSGAIYGSAKLNILAVIVGGMMFGLGMTLVGTCGFGLLVRTGGGDLRAAMASVVVGIAAMAATGGLLGPIRLQIISLGVVDLVGVGGANMSAIAAHAFGQPAGLVIALAIAGLLAGFAALDRRLWLRPRLAIGAVAMGLSIALGWWTTSRSVEALTLDRPESLSFVAPVGRALLQLMSEPFRNIGFGVAAMLGVIVASAAVAVWRGEVRWEAFDDAAEMRRHLFGGALMGIGGVLAQGCTIGQGLSGGSTLALSAPLFLIAIVLGARIGFWHLLEGRSLWRLGRS